LDDLYKQLQDFEKWKANVATFTNPDILLMLPEFNMDKHMPVEDDENLDKKEEW
jgi:hypothetical protein